MLNDILKTLEGMTEAEKQDILNTEFPAELEKQAAAHIDAEQLREALYNYGWLAAERAVAEEDGLDKVASEDLEAHDQAVEECGQAIEDLLTDLGTAEIEDTAELHKEAQVCASIMFDGYSDFMDKLAASKGKAAMGAIKGALKSVKSKLSKGVAAGQKKGKKALKMIRKHPGKAALIAGGAAAGGYAGKKGMDHMKKKASDASVLEMAQAVAEIQGYENELLSEVTEGVEKLAAKGGNKAAEFLKKHYGKAKEMAGAAKKSVKKHKGLYGLGAGAAGGAAATHAAHKASE